MNFLVVGLGGGLGAAARYGIGLLPWRGSFPVSTLIINLLGAVVIGFLSGFAVRRRMDDRLVLFLKTGLCGGFTTFSTFSLESVQLIAAGDRGQAALYIFLSLAGCLLGVWLGQALSRTLPELS
ncbi:putative fluoride ion transporter CrcB [bioreactor metagenome]|jgi:CrcB protein|uniref:Putative fluoride ion transporter CrcB n=1 Tax=bioreactor metagenome TaxID=1076179 RepID=A0A645D2B3_9ZZZZ|nr:fluoride efflux transporter CrcB [Oscillibacter sp.]